MTDRLAGIVTGSSNTTYVIDRPCPEPGSHRIVAITDEYGNDTPHLWCQEHGEVVGYVE